MQQKLFSGSGFYIGQMFREAASRHGAVPVVLDRPLDVAPESGLQHTYRSLADLVDRLADQLWTAGVRPASHVAIHKRDNADIALLGCAASRIGAIPVLLSPGLDAAAASILLSRLDRPFLVTDEATLSGLAAHTDIAALTGKRIVVSGVFPGAVTLDGLEVTGRARLVRLHPDEPAMITHSSGTTDVPKLAVHCARALWNRLVPQKAMALPVRGETAAFCMSFVHSRFYHALGTFLSGGSRLLLLVDHDPASVGPLLARWQPGVVETHPNTFVLWEDLADAPGAPLRNVRCFGSTFDAIHPRTVQRLLGASRRRGKYLMQLYGQSETGPVAVRLFTERGAARNGRLVGVGIPGFTKVRITDDSGAPVPRGTVGHIEARTRGRIITYQGAQDRYDAQLNGSWWRMGDMGTRSWWGGLNLIDREIDRIDDVDSNLRIEDVLMSRLDELREVVVVPGADGVAVPVVCTRTGAPLAPARWRSATADLPVLATPQQWAFDDLPRTSTWKIKRVALAQLIAAGDSAVAHG
ncbi:class I adenylate-forming enzyme family protein [Lentzea aerocolonigenes]|uniref:class I adenylate-forming enzyme family protein n=1 Tax=Lentzea aerocolonigenes TaxID=68170 RepID=UPI0005614697|nr:class I adenylate-forming enzyme family protein [Lentzea aerocolonigenes]MCP2241795.1 Acyl-CoA synthetase (AMP-forming)/AMP-acid ligase II [Lentzea aerocolonigenes]